jgi:hypothetical protein
MKSSSNMKPGTLEAVGNGSYLYNFNVVEREVTNGAEDDAEATETQYDYEQVVVWSPVTSNRITEAVITDRWPSNYEQKLVNEYNAANLGVYGAKTSDTAKAKIQAYTDYLTERQTLKEMVDADCATLGIE